MLLLRGFYVYTGARILQNVCVLHFLDETSSSELDGTIHVHCQGQSRLKVQHAQQRGTCVEALRCVHGSGRFTEAFAWFYSYLIGIHLQKQN